METSCRRGELSRKVACSGDQKLRSRQLLLIECAVAVDTEDAEVPDTRRALVFREQLLLRFAALRIGAEVHGLEADTPQTGLSPDLLRDRVETRHTEGRVALIQLLAVMCSWSDEL